MSRILRSAAGVDDCYVFWEIVVRKDGLECEIKRHLLNTASFLAVELLSVITVSQIDTESTTNRLDTLNDANISSFTACFVASG